MKKRIAVLLLCALALALTNAMGESMDGGNDFWADARWTGEEAQAALFAYRRVAKEETAVLFSFNADGSDVVPLTMDVIHFLDGSQSFLTRRALLDMDGDGVPELAIERCAFGTYVSGYFILNYSGGQVFCRGVNAWNLKDDGSFEDTYCLLDGRQMRVTGANPGSVYDDREVFGGFWRLRLNGAAMEKEPYVCFDLRGDEHICEVDGVSVDFDTFSAAVERENAKEEPDWRQYYSEQWVDDGETLALFQRAARNEIPVRFSAYYDGMEMDETYQEMTLGDLPETVYGEGFVLDSISLVDLDMDQRPEMVIEVYENAEKAEKMSGYEAQYEYIVLKAENGAVYAHQFVNRAMSRLRHDGTFSYSSGARDSGFGRAWFHGPRHGIAPITWCESGGEMETVYYYVNGAPATAEEFDQALEAQRNKTLLGWFPLREDMIDRLPGMRAW